MLRTSAYFLRPVHSSLQFSSGDWWKCFLFFALFQVFFWTSSTSSGNDVLSLRTFRLVAARILEWFEAVFWWEVVHGSVTHFHNGRPFVTWTQTSEVLYCWFSLLERSFSCTISMCRLLSSTILRLEALFYFLILTAVFSIPPLFFIPCPISISLRKMRMRCSLSLGSYPDVSVYLK